MTSTIVIVALILLGTIGAVYLALSKKLGELREVQKDSTLANLVNHNISETRNALDKNLTNLNESFGGKLDKAREVFAALSIEIQAMKDIGRGVEDLRAQFNSPKLRGNFGEAALKSMLVDGLPGELFDDQYKFKDGQTVDAVVKTRDGLIPIDSKFPIDNFRRMLTASTDEARVFERGEFQKAAKKHVGDIAKKYIVPGEGTTDFAVMFVPSEACFYEIISVDELRDFAQQSRVMLVSPSTLYYFLYVIKLGLEQTRVEENVKKVWSMLAGFHQETMKFGDQLDLVARHITNAKGAMDAAQSGYEKLAGKVDQIKQLK